LVGKSAGKRSLGIARRGWEDNMKIDLKESQEVMDWDNLVQGGDK